MIGKHLAFLLECDDNFQQYWENLGENVQERRLALAEAIDRISSAKLEERFIQVSEAFRRYLSCVPQKDLDYGRRPWDWSEFVADLPLKQELYQESQARLLRFLRQAQLGGVTRIYGNIKPSESLRSSIGVQKPGVGGRRRLRDTWDVVRFRIVAENLVVLRRIGIELWRAYLDEIVRSRNYYLQPKGDSLDDPYRALHFELEIVPGRWIEVQVLTEARDLVGFFDYALVFKRKVEPMNRSHLNWLLRFSRKASIFDGNHSSEKRLRR